MKTYFPTYLLTTYRTYFLPTEWVCPVDCVTKIKLDVYSVKVHPQLSHNGHGVDDALVVASSL